MMKEPEEPMVWMTPQEAGIMMNRGLRLEAV